MVMERLSGINQEFIEQLAESEYNKGATDDIDLEPWQRRDRVGLEDTETNLCTIGPVKRFDDVELWDYVKGRVVGPARDENFFLVHAPEEVANHGNLIACNWEAVTDRAPHDPEEDPMPPGEGDEEPTGEPGEIDLAPLQMEAFRRIDARSDELIKAGFLFNNVVYSCSLEAQIRYNAMMMLADGFTYPLELNSLNDRDKGIITNANEMRGFCLTALAHVRSVVDSGTVHKDTIRQATDPQAILNFVDPRQPPEPVPYTYENPNSGSNASGGGEGNAEM